MNEAQKKEAYGNYLEALRKSGKTNMYGAAPYLAKEFSLSFDEAVETLVDWMINYGGDDRHE